VLRVAQIIPDTEAEGPGRRFAVWVQGCPMRCAGCCNPQMLRFEGGDEIAEDDLAGRVGQIEGVEGISLLGGEPFAQAVACAAFAERVRANGLSVMIYTGFTLSELEAKRERGEPGIGELLAACDVLVDGPYDREKPERERRWIGSTNQVMHFLSDRYRADDPRLRAENTVEIRLRRSADGTELIVNGWPALAAAVKETPEHARRQSPPGFRSRR
jgi:anaerobic ribonucleoside-triphosphate reductase activating protein